MNASLYNADRTTHLRIIAVALTLSLVIAGFAVSARISAISGDLRQSQAIPTLEKSAV